jgi:hypothetical protein
MRPHASRRHHLALAYIVHLLSPFTTLLLIGHPRSLSTVSGDATHMIATGAKRAKQSVQRMPLDPRASPVARA